MSHRAPHQDEDLYDITTAASVAEAEMLEAANADRAKTKEAAAQAHPATTSGKDTSATTTTATAFPPVDIFASPSHWTLHFSVAGARKGDVAVAWDEGRSAVVVKGVVNLPGGRGGQEGLGSLVASERRVGGFERVVEVPPVVVARGEGKGGVGVDGRGVESWLEDGVLVVRVPKKGGGGA
jgi:HSP20 family molecular chaperone IbpA